MVKGWVESVKSLVGVFNKHPKYAYTGLQKSFKPGIRDTCSSMEEGLKETFFLALFKGLGEDTLERWVTCLPVKKAGLALLDPTKTAPENWTASFFITGHPIVALRGQEEFWTADQSAFLHERRTEVRNWSVLLAE